ncbi:response regulator, partial [Klebsiella pneumoniae]|nr:response regulator [Klebsiella pneumoniae]
MPHFYFIDDDEASRYVLKNLTRTFTDATSLEFESAEAAMVSLRNEHMKTPSLIFLDLNMPGQSGFDFLREIKSDAR